MQITTDNITWNFVKKGNDLMSDEETLGLSYLYIPGPMLKRFKRECGHKDSTINRLLLPHYSIDDVYNQQVDAQSGHSCYNSDTQIVLMHYLRNKRRKYKLDYEGLDPFWIFHDMRHAKHDVWGDEVQGIWSDLEYERLLEGAEFAITKGIHISADSVYKLLDCWAARWKFREGQNYKRLSLRDFQPVMLPEEFELVDESISMGINLAAKGGYYGEY
jgi:hypothetical protein